MKSATKRTLIAALMLCIMLLVLASCNGQTGDGTQTTTAGGSSVTDPIGEASVKFENPEISLGVGGSTKLEAIVENDEILEYSSSNSKVVMCDKKGKLFASAAGKATITVTTVGGKSATCKVTVYDVYTVSLDAQTFNISKGQTFTLTATATKNKQTVENAEIVWKSSDEKIATVVDGVVTGVGAGNVTITAEYGGQSASAAGTVEDMVVEFEVKTDERTAIVKVDGKYDGQTTSKIEVVVAKINGADSASQIVWTSADESIATVSGGIVTGVASGSTTITAKLGTLEYTIPVNVYYPVYDVASFLAMDGVESDGYKARSLNYILVNDIDFTGVSFVPIAHWDTVNDTKATNLMFSGIFEGNGHTLKNIDLGSGGKLNQQAVFSMVSGTVRNLNLVNIKYSEGGMYYGGIVAITNGGKFENIHAEVTMGNVGRTSGAISAWGINASFKNIFIDINKDKDPTSNLCTTFGWRNHTATVAENCFVITSHETLVTDLPNGIELKNSFVLKTIGEIEATLASAEITLDERWDITRWSSPMLDPNFEYVPGLGSGEVTPDEFSVTLDQTELKLNLGMTATLQAFPSVNGILRPSASVAWSISDPAIATVENGVITPLAAGNAVITVTFEGQSATCNLTVENKVVELEINNAELTAVLAVLDKYAGKTGKIEIIKANINGTDASSSIVWTSADESIATVNGGVVTGVASGKTTITAKLDELSVEIPVVVYIPVYDTASFLAMDGVADDQYAARKLNYYLTCDLDFAGVNFMPIAHWDTVNSNNAKDLMFSGLFDGNGHTISNVDMNTSGKKTQLGVFSMVSGTVRNVNFENITYVEKTEYSGGVVAIANGATFENIHVSATMNNTGRVNAGVAAWALNCKFNNIFIELTGNTTVSNGLVATFGWRSHTTSTASNLYVAYTSSDNTITNGRAGGITYTATTEGNVLADVIAAITTNGTVLGEDWIITDTALPKVKAKN